MTTFNEYSIRLCSSLDTNSYRSWSRVSVTQENSEREVVAERVRNYQRNGGNVIVAKLRLNEEQSAQITRIMDDLKFQERDSRFEWCLVEISLYNQSGIMTDWIVHGNCNASAAATIIHLITKRTPKPHLKPLDLYNSMMKGLQPLSRPPILGSGPPPPPPPPPPSNPIVVLHRSPVLKPSMKKKYKYSDYSSDSDGDSSWSSDSSVGNVRRRPRRYKARKARGKGKRLYNDSDSDLPSDSEDDDIIKVDLELKRGEDVVKALLELWTSDPGVNGKGKEKAV
jgi:hypothetical protein